MWVTGLCTSWSCSLTGSPAVEEGGHFIELHLPQLLILYTKRMNLSQMSGSTTLVNRNVGNMEEEINSWSPKNNQKMERNYKTGKTCLLFLANLTGTLPAGTLSLGLSLQSKGGRQLNVFHSLTDSLHLTSSVWQGDSIYWEVDVTCFKMESLRNQVPESGWRSLRFPRSRAPYSSSPRKSAGGSKWSLLATLKTRRHSNGKGLGKNVLPESYCKLTWLMATSSLLLPRAVPGLSARQRGQAPFSSTPF